MAETCKQVLKDVGVSPDRMSLEWASAAEGPRFVELITSYVNNIKSLGPLGKGPEEAGKIVKRRLAASVKAASVPKVRTAFGNLAKRLHKSSDYSPEAISKGVSEKVLPAFRKERILNEVKLCLADEGPLGLDRLAELTGADPEELEKIISPLVKKGILKEEGSGWALAQ